MKEKYFLRKLRSMIKLNERMSKIKKENKSIVSHLLKSVPLMEEDEFWSEIERLNKFITRIDEGYSSSFQNFPYSITQFLEKEDEKTFRDKIKGMMKFMSFVATYYDKIVKLHTRQFHAKLNCSDDSFYDIVDSYPLYGRVKYNEALELEVSGEASEYYQGENYVLRNLNKRIRGFGAFYGGKEYRDFIEVLLSSQKKLPLLVGVKGEAAEVLQERLTEIMGRKK